MFANSLFILFSSSSLALAFLRSAINCTRPRMFELFPELPRLRKLPLDRFDIFAKGQVCYLCGVLFQPRLCTALGSSFLTDPQVRSSRQGALLEMNAPQWDVEYGWSHKRRQSTYLITRHPSRFRARLPAVSNRFGDSESGKITGVVFRCSSAISDPSPPI